METIIWRTRNGNEMKWYEDLDCRIENKNGRDKGNPEKDEGKSRWNIWLFEMRWNEMRWDENEMKWVEKKLIEMEW